MAQRLENPLPATEPPSAIARLTEVERSIRGADPCAFPVPPRIVRRVIRHETDLPALSGRLPHRKSIVVSAAHLKQVVLNDELGLEPSATLPDAIILLARPEETELEEMTAEALVDHYRRLHFHARIHLALDERIANGRLDEVAVRERIDRIGPSAFNEVRTVLQQESFLLPPVSAVSTYVEFAAVFLELRYFAADVLATYFPSLDDFNRVEAVLAEDVEPDEALAVSADIGVEDSALETGRRPTTRVFHEPAPLGSPVSGRGYERLLRDAAIAAARGNDVRAAILHSRAERSSIAALAERAATLAAADMGRLAGRLAQALGMSQHAARAWNELLAALLTHSAEGFWNADARMLYDLQKVCLDFERESYVIDLASWLRSFGRMPLKRPLPAQREVLMSKHLRSAIGRLGKVQLAAGQREHLGLLLRKAASLAEDRLRLRLRPPLEQTLFDVGFVPQNLPEQVAFRKIVEELLDEVVDRGYFAMGDIRDAIARNNLKLDDVADPWELIGGDRLLRADRKLANVLDGVYQRGAFYLRLLQGISSCAFGTRPGRFFTRYLAIPFGGAFVLLAALDHLIHAATRLMGGAPSEPGTAASRDAASTEAGQHPVHLTTPYLVLLVGLVLLALVNNAGFRKAVVRSLKGFGRGLRVLFVDFPRWFAEVTLIRRLMHSPVVVFLRKRLLTSAALTAAVCWLVPALGWYDRPSPVTVIGVFLAFVAILNSRAGRDIEELTAERVQLTWHRIRVRVLVAIFDLVMDSFKRIVEGVERILYEVDEWLRFKSGETSFTLGVKAFLGLIWSVVRFVIGFFVTVLFEPQVNPIKHFPVVTVSHKVIFPFQPMLTHHLIRVFGAVLANTLAGMIVLLLPGVVGFLVWELRGNWRLYAVNRQRSLVPVIVGSHGETMLRLLKLGIHSGTIPRLFARLRRAARRARGLHRLRGLMSNYSKLHHVELEVRRLFERELLGYLRQSLTFRELRAEIGRIELGTNSLHVEIRLAERGDPLWLGLEEHAGRLIAGIVEPGWALALTRQELDVLCGLLVGFYRFCGVELVREQLAFVLDDAAASYEVTETGIVAQLKDRETPAVLDLDESPLIHVRTVRSGLKQVDGVVEPKTLVFRRSETVWSDWIAEWSVEQRGEPSFTGSDSSRESWRVPILVVFWPYLRHS